MSNSWQSIQWIPDGNNNLGLVWVQQGQFDEAINCYNRALQVRPDFVAARNNLQRARDMKKRTQGCDAQSVSSQDSPRLQAVTGSAPEYQLGNTCAETAVAAVNQGVALAQQGRMDEAKVYFEQARSFNRLMSTPTTILAACLSTSAATAKPWNDFKRCFP